MAGTWICSNPGWVDLVIFNKDGTFRRAQGNAGRWTLHEGILTLHWKDWPEESLRLISNDEFRGKPRDKNSPAEIVLHRCD